mmetsp:Transcript_29623/g.70610  ORF Transcript_29623/g.70610 Transcript_29623/m.70610 type:complete len:281 (-) Transcript_29623:275-1117(-)
MPRRQHHPPRPQRPGRPSLLRRRQLHAPPAQAACRSRRLWIRRLHPWAPLPAGTGTRTCRTEGTSSLPCCQWKSGGSSRRGMPRCVPRLPRLQDEREEPPPAASWLPQRQRTTEGPGPGCWPPRSLRLRDRLGHCLQLGLRGYLRTRMAAPSKISVLGRPPAVALLLLLLRTPRLRCLPSSPAHRFAHFPGQALPSQGKGLQSTLRAPQQLRTGHWQQPPLASQLPEAEAVAGDGRGGPRTGSLSLLGARQAVRYRDFPRQHPCSAHSPWRRRRLRGSRI